MCLPARCTASPHPCICGGAQRMATSTPDRSRASANSVVQLPRRAQCTTSPATQRRCRRLASICRVSLSKSTPACENNLHLGLVDVLSSAACFQADAKAFIAWRDRKSAVPRKDRYAGLLHGRSDGVGLRSHWVRSRRAGVDPLGRTKHAQGRGDRFVRLCFFGQFNASGGAWSREGVQEVVVQCLSRCADVAAVFEWADPRNAKTIPY